MHHLKKDYPPMSNPQSKIIVINIIAYKVRETYINGGLMVDSMCSIWVAAYYPHIHILNNNNKTYI